MKTNRFLRYALTLSVALYLTGPAFTQLTSTAPPANGSTAATAPVAYVYVGTSKGINLYNAASNGKLTLVSGSPFKTTGLMIGSNQKYFITLGTIGSAPTLSKPTVRSARRCRRSIRRTTAVAIAGRRTELFWTIAARMCMCC